MGLRGRPTLPSTAPSPGLEAPAKAEEQHSRRRTRWADHAARVKKHIRLFKKLFHNFVILCGIVQEQGGTITIEWPTACNYWSFSVVNKCLEDFGLHKVRIHGCRLGLVSVVDGKPIKKPWTLATSNWFVYNEFDGKRCNHRPEEHAKCEGKDTKLSENYTNAMVDTLHRALKKQVKAVEKYGLEHGEYYGKQKEALNAVEGNDEKVSVKLQSSHASLPGINETDNSINLSSVVESRFRRP